MENASSRNFPWLDTREPIWEGKLYQAVDSHLIHRDGIHRIFPYLTTCVPNIFGFFIPVWLDLENSLQNYSGEGRKGKEKRSN